MSFSRRFISRAMSLSLMDSSSARRMLSRSSFSASWPDFSLYTPSMRSLMRLTTVRGVMPWMMLCSSCLALRRAVSSMALRIDSVVLSAYKIATPLTLRAARPMVCISERSERKKPSLSASNMATNDTSGKSIPSRSKLMPTNTSNTPRRKSRKISTRSTVSMSLCK